MPQVIEGIVGQKRGGDVGRSQVRSPENMVCVGEVSLGIFGIDSNDSPRVVATACQEGVIGMYGAGNNVVGQAPAGPQD